MHVSAWAVRRCVCFLFSLNFIHIFHTLYALLPTYSLHTHGLFSRAKTHILMTKSGETNKMNKMNEEKNQRETHNIAYVHKRSEQQKILNKKIKKNEEAAQSTHSRHTQRSLPSHVKQTSSPWGELRQNCWAFCHALWPPIQTSRDRRWDGSYTRYICIYARTRCRYLVSIFFSLSWIYLVRGNMFVLFMYHTWNNDDEPVARRVILVHKWNIYTLFCAMTLHTRGAQNELIQFSRKLGLDCENGLRMAYSTLFVCNCEIHQRYGARAKQN